MWNVGGKIVAIVKISVSSDRNMQALASSSLVAAVLAASVWVYKRKCKGRNVASTTIVLHRTRTTGEYGRVKLTAVDVQMATLPILISGFPTYVFKYTKAPSPEVLSSSLAELLDSWRIFAGRFAPDGVGKAIIMNDCGVPLNVRQREGSVADFVSSQDMMWSCTDFRGVHSVANGSDPVLTVTLTTFEESGEGVVAIARSHGVADGGTFADFLSDWSNLIQKKSSPPVHLDRAVDAFPLEDTLQMVNKETGEPASVDSTIKQCFMNVLKYAYNQYEMTKLAWGKPLFNRPQLFFSHQQMDNLKALASTNLTKVPWITTNEAFIAHLVLELPKISKKSGNKIGVLLWLDGRRLIGQRRHCTGTAMIIKDFVFNTEGKTLSMLAEEVQLQLKALDEESVKQTAQLYESITCHHINQLGPLAMKRMQNHNCDHVIMLNNQSKVPLLDLGCGEADWAVSSSGPSVMLPHKDGMQVLFDDVTLPKLPHAQIDAVQAQLTAGL